MTAGVVGFLAFGIVAREIQIGLEWALSSWVWIAYFVLLGVSLVCTILFWTYVVMESGGPARIPRSKSTGPNACHKCRYSFEGLADIERCPECGTPLSYEQLVVRAKSKT
jgi:hypothetical protein